jgi:wyosine [tRNA(Phe)-imidazoG37] synthetase (radical SAM superfamily)
MQVRRGVFYSPQEIARDVVKKAAAAKEKGEPVDYLTFVSDGEPALDINLGEEIALLKPLGTKIAVITNASLIAHKDVRDDLCQADWVSVKIDAISEDVWRRVNRPHPSLRLGKIVEGIAEFSRVFSGTLATETMLVAGSNDTEEEIAKIANYIAALKAVKSFISVPIRPPAEKWVRAPGEHTVNAAYQIFKEKRIDVEYLIGYEGDAFACTGNAEEDLLSITAVHPMKKEAVEAFLRKARGEWSLIEKLVAQGKLTQTAYKNDTFYLRRPERNADA